ncbi:MAG: hypothetical protein SFU86_09690 [Pirellulaceae bacterium]|nr:hypothetical protein [Pirellulaceae bacterium]
MHSTLVWLFTLAMLPAAVPAWGEPYVEHLDPPLLGRGSNRMVVVGADVDRVVGVWTSLPADKVRLRSANSASRQRSELELEVAANCPIGLYGLRLATEDGLSNLCLFAIDELAPQAKLADPQTDFPAAVAGALEAATVARHRVQVAAGQKLCLEVIAGRFGTDADPLLTIYDPQGRKVAQQDNEPGLLFDCRLEHTFAQGGIHTIEVRDSRFLGSPDWRYVLRIGESLPALRQMLDPAAETAAGLRLATETEPNDAPEAATLAGIAPVVLHGAIGQPRDRDQYLLDLKAGQKLILKAETKAIGSAADVELTLFDATGRELSRNDDATLPGNVFDEATLSANINKDGIYRLQIRDMSAGGGPQFAYRVAVLPVVPKFQLTSDFSGLAVPRGSHLSLPVEVVRTDFTGPIELSLAGAPPGVSLVPTTIPEGATSLDCRLLVAGDVPLGLHSLVITGRGQEGEVTINGQLAVQPLVDRQLVNVDLIKHALRDNQRYLPPSVTDKIALQVIAAAPFQIELPEAVVTLPRYQQASLRIAISRQAGFDGPISFVASGGQLGEESQGRKQVFGRFPIAAADQASVIATIHSRSLAQEAKERIDLFATAKQGERTITLIRSFTLDCKPAFSLVAEPKQLTLAPGATAKIELALQRLPGYLGPVMIQLTPAAAVSCPQMLEIAASQTKTEFEVAVAADAKPGRQRVRLVGLGQVETFQEETKPLDIDVDIKVEKKP